MKNDLISTKLKVESYSAFIRLFIQLFIYLFAYSFIFHSPLYRSNLKGRIKNLGLILHRNIFLLNPYRSFLSFFFFFKSTCSCYELEADDSRVCLSSISSLKIFFSLAAIFSFLFLWKRRENMVGECYGYFNGVVQVGW